MSRISYEGSMLIVIVEGLQRNSHYYYEPKLCTIGTEHTISTMIQRDINQGNLYKIIPNDNYQEMQRLRHSYTH